MRFEFEDNNKSPISQWKARAFAEGRLVATASGNNLPRNEGGREGAIFQWTLADEGYAEEFMRHIQSRFAEMTWVAFADDLSRHRQLKQFGWRCRCINVHGQYVFGWRRDGKNDGFAVWRDGSFHYTVAPEA